MKILMLDMGSYTFRDTKDTILSLGHEVDEIYYHFEDRFKDDFFCERINLYLKRKRYDAILSINFFPLLSIAANEHGIPYISWSYDSPLAERLTDYFCYDTNRIFLFDRNEVDYYNSCGYKNVFHLPLAINPSRINNLSFSAETNQKYQADISFVGVLHDSYLNELLFCADDYIKGFVEGLFQAQFRLYGYNFIHNSITNEMIESLNKSYSQLGNDKVKLNRRGLSYAINDQITHEERKVLLELLAENHDVRLYTTKKQDVAGNVAQYGPVKYFTDMNAVFRNSLLNLCPTLRSITSGIPLRALDVLANKAVLLSNYQTELAESFIDGKEVIMYNSLEDAVSKSDYYLAHSDLLPSIGIAGYQKAVSLFSYEKQVERLLSIDL